jgi:hypothetical protein
MSPRDVRYSSDKCYFNRHQTCESNSYVAVASSTVQRFGIDYESSVFRIFLSRCIEQTYIYRIRVLDLFTTKLDLYYVYRAVWGCTDVLDFRIWAGAQSALIEVFVVFLSPANAAILSRLDHNCFLLNSFQIFIKTFYHSTLHCLKY